MKWRMLPALVMVLAACMVMQDGRGAWAASDAPGGVVVICNDSVKTATLTRDNIQEMFLGRKTRWDDGQRIMLAVLKDSQAEELFLRDYVGKTPQQYSMYWDKQAFTGKGRGPSAFVKPQELIDFVKGTPGAVGFVPTDAYSGQVKSITVE